MSQETNGNPPGHGRSAQVPNLIGVNLQGHLTFPVLQDGLPQRDRDGIPIIAATATNLHELVQCCDEHWELAMGYLNNHQIQEFLTRNHLPFDSADQALEQNKGDLDLALEKFLESTGHAQRSFRLEPSNLTFYDKQPPQTIVLHNEGNGYFHGMVSVDVPRVLSVTPAEFAGHSDEVSIQVERLTDSDAIATVTVTAFGAITRTCPVTLRAPLVFRPHVLPPRQVPPKVQLVFELLEWDKRRQDSWLRVNAALSDSDVIAAAQALLNPYRISWPPPIFGFFYLLNIVGAVSAWHYLHSFLYAWLSFACLTAPLTGLWAWLGSTDLKRTRYWDALLFPACFAALLYGAQLLWGHLYVSVPFAVVLGGLLNLQLRSMFFPRYYDEWRRLTEFNLRKN